MMDDEIEIGQVLFCKGRNVQRCFREIKAPLIFQAESFGFCRNDAQVRSLRCQSGDDTIQLAIIDDDGVAFLKMVEYLGDTAGDDDISCIIRRIVGNFPPGEEKEIVCIDPVVISGDEYLGNPDFRAGQIHVNLATFLCFLFCLMDMTQHSLPHILRIVGAIDACHVHAGFQETADQFVVCGCFRRHGYHDIGVRCIGVAAENQIGIVGQNTCVCNHSIPLLREKKVFLR